MKKIIIITVIIIGIIIGSTAGLIKMMKQNLKDGNIIENITSGDEHVSEDIDNIKEKTLDLYGTYNQNDLLIIEKTINHEAFEEPITIKQISGLKNKEVENRVNKNIENRVLTLIDETIKENEINHKSFYMYDCANFSNIISFYCNISFRGDDYTKYFDKSIGLNYNLIDGEELKFKYLFTKNADIQTVIRDALYKKISRVDNVFWDEEKGKWMENTWLYDETIGDCVDVTIEYTPYLTENEINKIVKKFVSGIENNFYFSNAEINILEPESCNIKFEEFADMVVIYDKYLTNESLYENDNIGFKNILTCSREDITSGRYLYKETSYELDNFFYDISIEKLFYDEENLAEKVFSNKIDEIKNNANLKVEEYRKLAKDNPDKMYVLLLNPNVSICEGYFIENGINTYKFSNLASIDYYEKIITADISKKDEILYGLLGTYRYHNMGMYGDICSAINMIAADEYDIKVPIEENKEFVTFDAITGKTINDVSEIFKEDVNYRIVLENAFRDEYEIQYYYDNNGNKIYRTAEELDEIFENIEYNFSVNSIYVTVEGKYDISRNIGLTDSQIWPYLNVKELEYYLLPNSDKTNLTKEELQILSKEELNIAYNEIFARRGHDFKSKELKEYFNRMVWYTPIPNKLVTLEELSVIERENANLIKNIISEKH